MNKPTDKICALCNQRKDIFDTQMYSCSIECGHSFHSVCHACMHQLVRDALNKIPILGHLSYDYLPEGV